MEFGTYNDWPNKPSWSVFMALTSYYETSREAEHIAHASASRELERFVTGMVAAWKVGRSTPHQEAARILVQDFLMDGTRLVHWTAVLDTLRGEQPELGEADELTALAYTLLERTDWQAIVEDAEYLTDADALLRDWLQDRCVTWIESLDARQQRSAVAAFATRVLDVCLSAVQWEKVASALRSE